MSGTPAPPVKNVREWPRVLGLVVVLLGSAIAQPSVLLAVPFLVLVGATGVRGVPMFLAAFLAMTVVVAGSRDGLWYVERAWALMAGAGFVAWSYGLPKARFSERAMAGVFSAAAVCGLFFSVRFGSWAAIEFAASNRIMNGVAMVLDSFVVLQDGEALSPALATAVYQMAESQIELFPAVTAVASMAALALAWAAFSNLTGRAKPALGPVSEFRFNDHLVWLMIGGLILLLARSGDAVGRLGSNVVLFMGALYALRGVGVILFLTGGMSLLGFVFTGVGLMLVPPVVVVGAMMIGIGDTWLDVRARVRDAAA